MSSTISDPDAVAATLEALQLSDESDLPNMYKDKIPERVRCYVPLRVGPSNIPGAGRGMFVEQDVVGGDRLFTISDPVFLVVESGPEAEFICDNCYATMIDLQGQALQTIGGEPLKMSACGACRSVYYCKKSCQVEAWKHHHKFECKPLSGFRMVAIDLEQNHGLHSTREFRALLRLVLLRKYGKIPDAEWLEIRALRTGKEWRINEPYWSSTSTSIATNLLKFDPDLDLNEQEILELYWAIHENNLEISQPWLKAGSGCYDTEIGPSVGSGMCLEPFAAMINHNCRRNARYFFEGKQMSFRASRRIKAGEEITINYAIERGYDDVRRAQLHAWWNIVCQCKICVAGTPMPTAPLHQRVRSLVHIRPNDPSVTVKALKKAIADMKAGGWGYEVPPMWELHRRLFRAYADQKDYPNVLKTGFTAYAVIAPLQRVVVFPEQANDMLGNILQLLDPIHIKKCKLDSTANFMFQEFYPMLFDKYVMEVRKLYGRTSRVSWQAGWFLQRQLEVYRVKREKEGQDGYYVLIEEDEKQKKNFVQAMNTILKWVELPPTTTMEKLFRF